MCDDHQPDRRTFIRDMGKGVIGVAIGGMILAACGTSETTTTVAGTAAGSTTGPLSSSAPTIGPAATSSTIRTATSVTEAGTSTAAVAPSLVVERVNMGFVSAYLLVRGTEVAIVDTGTSGNTGAIEATLSDVGLGWANVGNVILTHKHGDHVGSLPGVADAASQAVLGTGVEDVAAVSAPRSIEGYTDGQIVFGLQIITTPGHTPGHISVWDPDTAVLVAGDALSGEGSGVGGVIDGVAGPNPEFSPDMDGAIASARKMETLAPDSIYFGHGEPKNSGAAAALTALAESL